MAGKIPSPARGSQMLSAQHPWWAVRAPGHPDTEPPVCRTHDGAAPQVKAAAERCELDRRARSLVGQMGTDLKSHVNDPLADLTGILNQDMAMVARYEAVSEQQGDLGGIGPRRQRRLPRRAGRRQPAVELMIKSGVAAKVLALHEEQARAAASAKGDHQARCGDHRSRHLHRRCQYRPDGNHAVCSPRSRTRR